MLYTEERSESVGIAERESGNTEHVKGTMYPVRAIPPPPSRVPLPGRNSRLSNGRESSAEDVKAWRNGHAKGTASEAYPHDALIFEVHDGRGCSDIFAVTTRTHSTGKGAK